MLLQKKTAFITGGSKGIGYAICKQCILNGVEQLAYFSRYLSPKHDELLQLANEYNVVLYHYDGSVTDDEVVSHSLQDFTVKAGKLDILVNNAGITRDKLVIGLQNDDWDDVISTNLRSVFVSCKIASKIMIKQRQGSIVNVSSVVGIEGNIGQSNYAASKAGIIGFTKSISKEIAKRGVRVNVVAPGLVRTDMTTGINEEYKQKLLDSIPLGKIGEAEDIAEPVVFLCSSMARYITGEVLVVSGGM